MISIGALIALISFDVTARLVEAGQVFQSWTIASVSNTTPIHVTTTVPHGVAPAVKMHAVVAGVGGTTAANDIWELAYVDDSTFSLGTYSPVGAPVASVGNGVYTSGGTISTALDQGRILLGRKFLQSNGTPPRIVFVPSAAPTFDLVPLGGATEPLSTLPPTITQMTPEQIAMTEQPPILTDHSRYEVTVWGAATPSDPDFADFDVTRALRDQVIASGINLISQPFFKVLGGVWKSQLDGERQSAWDTLGQAYKMLVEIVQPIVDKPFAYVPFGIHATLTVQPKNPGSSDPIVIVTPSVP